MASLGPGGMTAGKRATLNKMEIVLRRFKLQELEKHLLHHFTHKSWDYILDKFSESELPVNVLNLASFFCKSIRKMTTTEIFELGEICLLFDIYLHSLRKMWYLIELSGGESIGMVSSSEMKESIVKECKQQKLPHVHITILRQESKYWLSVRVEKKSKSTSKKLASRVTEKFQLPIFFAIDEDFMYTTTTKSRMTKGLVRAVANAIGYDRASFKAESGRNFIDAKERMCWKRQRANVSVSALPEPKFKHKKMLDGKGVDFGNRAAKEKYMDALFGPNPPAINQMKFTAKTFKLGVTGDEKEDAEWSKIRMKATLLLKSDNVVNFVKRLTLDHGMYEFPPPSRVTNYFKDLKEQSDSDDSDL